MTLIEHRQAVGSVRLAAETRLDDDVFSINGVELAQIIEGGDERIASAAVHVALPGDPVRIVCAKDVIQPRVKLDHSPSSKWPKFAAGARQPRRL